MSGSGSASRWKVGTGFASRSASSKNQHPHPDPHQGDKSNPDPHPDPHQCDADPQHYRKQKQIPTLFPSQWYESWLTCCVKSGIRWESTAGSNIRRPPPLSPSTILMVKHPESVYSSSFTFFSLLGCCPEDSPLGELPPPPSHQTGSSQQGTCVIKRFTTLLDFKEIFSRYLLCVFASFKGAQAWDIRSFGFSWFLHHKVSMRGRLRG